VSFSKNLGDILFKEGWSLGPLSNYVGPETENRLLEFTGYDDSQMREELCLDGLKAARVISQKEYVEALVRGMAPSQEHADRRMQPAPQIDAVLPNGKKVTLGEKANEPKFSG